MSHESDTKQKQTINFLMGKQGASLDASKGFGLMAAGGRMPTRPQPGRAIRPYQVTGNKQIAKMDVIGQKRDAASGLMGQAALNSVAGMAHTMQIAFAIALSIQDEEQAAFLVEYVRNIINYLSVTEAQFLEILRENLEALIQEGVDPSFLERLQGRLGG